jgi:hypothetical protein
MQGSRFSFILIATCLVALVSVGHGHEGEDDALPEKEWFLDELISRLANGSANSSVEAISITGADFQLYKALYLKHTFCET